MLHINYQTKKFFDLELQKFFTKTLKRWWYETKINYWIRSSSAWELTIRHYGSPAKYRYLNKDLRRKCNSYYYLWDWKMTDINEYHKKWNWLFCKRILKNQKPRLRDMEEAIIQLRHKWHKKWFFTYEEKKFKFIEGKKYHRRWYNDNEHLTKIISINWNTIIYKNFFGEFTTSKARFKTMFYIK